LQIERYYFDVILCYGKTLPVSGDVLG
jgi:hypothetical protein